MVRVAIIDDHESVRLGVSAVCAMAGYEVVHSVSTVDAFLARAAEQPVDIVVLDLSLEDGSTITSNVQRAHSTGAAVLIHSIADRVASVREALVVDSIATVAAGGVLNNLEWASAIDADSEFATVQLGRRERDVLHLYASGLPLKQVALELGIAVSTAKEHLGRIRSKYVEVGRPAPTKVDLLRRAVEDGILPELNPGQADGD